MNDIYSSIKTNLNKILFPIYLYAGYAEVVVLMVNPVHVEKTVNQDALVNPVDQETTVKPKKARMDLLDHPVLQECPVWMATMVKTVSMVNMVNVDHQVDVENQAKMAAEVMTVNLANVVDLV